MSFAGGSSKALPAPTPKPLGLDESRASTNEQARPVPYLAGKTRVGVTWISDAFDIKTVAVTQSAGKGKSTTTGYNYYASMVALVCHGAVEGIEKIYFNGDEVWSGDITKGATENYVEITIEGHGKMRLYWGTDAQVAPDDNPALDEFSLHLTQHGHPPYKNQCYVIFHQLFFGFNQTNAPNVEFVVRRYPKPEWLHSVLTTNVMEDCNPVAIVAEWLQNKVYGLGWPEARLDTVALEAVAAQLAAENIGVSPFITKQTGARQLITQLCEYFDGYALLTPEGKFKLGLIRQPEDVDALPVIDEDVLLEEPELQPASWSGVKSKTWVKFTDRDRAFKENALPYRDPGTALITTDNTPQTVERPWVTRANLAQKMAAALGRASALPASEGSITVRKSAALAPGVLFRLSYAQLGISNLLMRVTSSSPGKPGSREVSLDVALDRSYLNESYYVPEDDGPVNAAGIEPKKFDEQILIELPAGLNVDDKITLAPVVVRPDPYTTKYDVHLRRNYELTSAQPYRMTGIDNAGFFEDLPITGPVYEGEGVTVHFSYPRAGQFAALAQQGKLLIVGSETMAVLSWKDTEQGKARVQLIRGRNGTRIVNHTAGEGFYFYQSLTSMFNLSYDRIADHTGFALTGTLIESYPADTNLIDLSRGFEIDLGDKINELIAPSLNNALENELLIFLNDEVLSLAEMTVLENGHARLFPIRARYDTRRQMHASASKAYIIAKAQLERLTHTSFVRSGTCAVKLQATAFGKQADLSTLSPVGLTFTDRVHEPLAPINLRAFGDRRNPVYSTGDDILLAWDLTENGEHDFWARCQSPATDLPGTILDFYTVAGVLQDSLTLGAGTADYTYTNVRLLSKFTSETTFKVRATALKNGLKSRFYDELTIRKI